MAQERYLLFAYLRKRLVTMNRMQGLSKRVANCLVPSFAIVALTACCEQHLGKMPYQTGRPACSCLPPSGLLALHVRMVGEYCLNAKPCILESPLHASVLGKIESDSLPSSLLHSYVLDLLKIAKHDACDPIRWDEVAMLQVRSAMDREIVCQPLILSAIEGSLFRIKNWSGDQPTIAVNAAHLELFRGVEDRELRVYSGDDSPLFSFFIPAYGKPSFLSPFAAITFSDMAAFDGGIIYKVVSHTADGESVLLTRALSESDLSLHESEASLVVCNSLLQTKEEWIDRLSPRLVGYWHGHFLFCHGIEFHYRGHSQHCGLTIGLQVSLQNQDQAAVAVSKTMIPLGLGRSAMHRVLWDDGPVLLDLGANHTFIILIEPDARPAQLDTFAVARWDGRIEIPIAKVLPSCSHNP